MNKRIITSIFVIGMLTFTLGAGTQAWFSDSEDTETVILTAGTMAIDVLETAPVATPSAWAPGENFTVTFKVKNEGTIPVNYLGGNLILTSGSWGFADVIEVVSIKEYIPGYGWIESMEPTQDYWSLVGDYAMPLTLTELAQSYYGSEPAYPDGKTDQFGGSVKSLTDWATGDGYDVVPDGTPAIPVGGTYQMKLTLKFSEDAGNAWQGASMGFKIRFVAVQDTSALP